jgi:hypothetical protein
MKGHPMSDKNKGREAIPCGRFSSDKQEAGDSKSRQAKSFARVCQRWELAPSSRYNIFDAGKSAYHGAHLGSGAELGKFLVQVKQGNVKPDGKGRMPVLCYEAVDRLTRLHPMDANDLLKGLVNAGIAIVFDEADLWIEKDTIGEKWIILQVLIENAWRYSKRLSTRSLSGKQTSRDKGTKFGACPRWLILDKETGEYEFNKPYSDMLYEACLLAIAGHGATTIGRLLPIKHWRGLPKVFRQRSLIGEWQPHLCNHKNKRTPIEGALKENFYPPLLTLVEWNRLQESQNRKMHVHAKTGNKGGTNLFSMLVNEKGEKLVIRQLKRGKNRHGTRYTPFLVSNITINQAKSTLNQKYNLVHYPTVEICLLNCLTNHITPAMLDPVQAKAESEMDRVKAKIAENKRKIATLSAMLENNPSENTFLIVLKLEKENMTLKSECDALTQKAAHNQPADLESAVDLIDTMKSKEGADLLDCRIRLKALIGSMVEKIVCNRTNNNSKSVEFVVTLKSGITLKGDGATWKKSSVTVWEEAG